MRNDLRPRRRPVTPDIDLTIDDKDKLYEVRKSTFNPKKLHHKIKNNHPLTKGEKWIIAAEITILVLAVVFFVLIITHTIKLGSSTPKPKSTSAVVIKKSAPVYISRLTGMPVTQAQSTYPVTGIMVENSDEARPQSGLSDAGVVFEAIAEGGITRFLALYEEENPGSIGPIRSARPYYIDWMLGFDASYVHVGGSPDALGDISADNVRDLNQFYNGSYFTRITTREAPHNVYSSMAELLALGRSKGYNTSTFTGFPRKADQPSKSPTATNINLAISGPDYNVQYTYDKSTNSYLRDEGGSPMIDANNNKRLSPKVVVAMVVPASQGALDASGAYYTVYSDIGNGTAYIFEDGIVKQGTWAKSSATSQITFTDTSGAPIAFNAGQTWITAVENTGQVSY